MTETPIQHLPHPAVESPTPAAYASPKSLPETVIEPTAGWRGLNLAELWRHRELIYFLAWRDVKVRYKQTGLGVAWALLQPLLAMAIFTFFLGGLAKVPSDNLPYALFAFTGILPWTYFANATMSAGTSLVGNTSLVSKVYFPRLVLPMSRVLPGLLDLAIGMAVLGVLLVVFGFPPTSSIFFVPLLIAFAVVTALAVSIWLSALDVYYRDVRYSIPFLIQMWMFATPVVYPASLLPEHYRVLYGLNPMTGVVEGFRWAVLGRGDPPGALMAVSAGVVLVILVTGALYFRRIERTFADII